LNRQQQQQQQKQKQVAVATAEDVHGIFSSSVGELILSVILFL